MGSVSAVLGLTQNECDFVCATILLTLLAATGAAIVRLFPEDYPQQPCRMETDTGNELASVDLFGRFPSPLMTPHNSIAEYTLASGRTCCTHETLSDAAAPGAATERLFPEDFPQQHFRM